jgi:hypothetical protein
MLTVMNVGVGVTTLQHDNKSSKAIKPCKLIVQIKSLMRNLNLNPLKHSPTYRIKHCSSQASSGICTLRAQPLQLSNLASILSIQADRIFALIKIFEDSS